MAPEVYRNEEYDTKVDVFSFALILQEVKVTKRELLSYIGRAKIFEAYTIFKQNVVLWVNKLNR